MRNRLFSCLLLLAAAQPTGGFLHGRATRPATSLDAVTKKNRRRTTHRNTFGTVGANALRKKEAELPNRVFFANVRYDVTEDDLKPFFSAVGPVTHLKIVRDSFSGQSKGWGFCTYSDPLYATTAIRSLHGREVRGRAIRLDDATSLSKRRKEKKVAEAFAAREEKRRARAAAEAAAALEA
eukprot:CAMPEP_0119260614 /NCGR_PEP_ID=MMETSP1329-20130426/915_1 /TAXON_ID=114041 /ORGANISM="Genus nov. species nov., Strain RCC1024" /LENGTH=180 /DNA_ID=CAMNT_0007260041 /DNA_START=121 /DNA_END=659 /DNA_ORIENTATION=+